jgi:hypothetical protein
MKLTKSQIMEKIKQLPPLTISEFHVFEQREKPLSLSAKMSNEEIVQGLDSVYREQKGIYSTNKTPLIVEEDYGISVSEDSQELLETSELEDSQELELEISEDPEVQIISDKDFRQTYYKTPVKNLKFKESPTFFSPRFQAGLEELLAEKPYSKLSDEEIIKLNAELQNLSTVEFEWKEYHRRSITKEMAHEQFKNEYEQFLVAFNTIRYPKPEDLKGQRARTKFLSYKIGFITHSLLHYLTVKLGFKALRFCEELTPEELGKIVEDHIDPRRIFNDLARISIKKAHEKLLNLREESTYKDDVLSIAKVELFEEFRKTLLVEIIYAVLAYGEKQSFIKSQVADTLSREVQIRIFYKNLLVSLESAHQADVLQFSDLTNSILEAFVMSDFFTDSINSTIKKNKTSTQLILPDHIVVEAYRPLKFPNIIRPPLLNKKDIDLLIKPLINGHGSLTKSDHLVATLNISRSKVHKVNELFLALARKFFPKRVTSHRNTFTKWLLKGVIDVGTCHPNTIENLYNEAEYLKDKMSSTILSLYIANCVISQLSISHSLPYPNFGSLTGPCGITRAETLRFYAAKVVEGEYVSKLIEAKYTQSRIFLAKQLQGYPLYITDILCIRLRMYPREHWLSRTAGSLKHLLQNSKARKLTQEGFTTLLEAYYTGNPEQLSDFKLYLANTKISNKNGKKLLTAYFQKNPLEFTKIRKPMYFLNLHLALLEAVDNGYCTAVNVEIDQNASALVILAIVLRSKEIAAVCNLTGGDSKLSPYDFIKEKCAEFLETELGKKELNIEKYADVCDFLRTSRKLHKYAIMCFCYNQTAMGRMYDFSDKWREEYGYVPNNTQRRGLNKFAAIYPKFVEFTFPNTDDKLNLLKDIVDLVCSEAPHLQMKTIDGEVINWAFYATTYKNRKYYDTVERSHKSFKISVLKQREVKEVISIPESASEFPENLVLDAKGMKRRFLSYLIHSIDASILRRIIYTMKKEHKVYVNHLHDCVILHPNDVSNFYKVIKEIYLSPELYNITFEGIFDPISNTLSPESNEKLNEYKQRFLELTTDFKDDLKLMNPHHMYSLED